MSQVLYIIHGWTYTTKYWDKTIALLEKSGIKVKLLHVPGLTATPKDKIFTIDDYVTWADKNLPQNAIVLGHSNGGRILLNLSAKHPNKLKHLILLNSAGIYYQPLRVKFLRATSKIFSFLKKIPLLRKILYKVLGISDYNQAPPNMKKTLAHMIQSDKNLDIAKIKIPTSILWGDADKTTPVWQGRKIHDQITGSTFKSFPDWDHAPYIKHPKTLTQEIIKIMENIR